MTTTRYRLSHLPLQPLMGLFIAFASIAFIACSNSETVGADVEGSVVAHCKDADTNISPIQENTKTKNDSLRADSTITEPASIDSIYSHEIACDSISKDLPLDDSEFPYAGIPRIVIETENHQAIKDRETEIPAKLQIWGENTPESEVMDLTIRGRGNTSWTEMPKKSYKIEFVNKQEMLGMPKDRDWALIANYADKTLMKNYLMYHLSSELEAYYAPRCEFAELYLNKEYLGVYLLTETIKIAKHRINIPKNEDSYLIEVDCRVKENEQPIYSTILTNETNKKAFRVHEPKNASEKVLSVINNKIESFERYLKTINPQTNNDLDQWIDMNEYIKHYWIQEFSKNPDADFKTSVYFSWEKNDVIKMGPVWDFDLAFGSHDWGNYSSPQNWHTKDAYWNKFLFQDSIMENSIHAFWNSQKASFLHTFDTIDSIQVFLQNAANNNFKRWEILQSTSYKYHRHSNKNYIDAVSDLKSWIKQRIEWIDSEIEK